MIPLELKQSHPVPLSRLLSPFVDPSDQAALNELQVFEDSRQQALLPAHSLDNVLCYLEQLQMISERFPLAMVSDEEGAEGTIKVAWTWSNFSSPLAARPTSPTGLLASLRSGRKEASALLFSNYSVRFERANQLLNVVIWLGKQAAQESLESVEGAKRAYQHLTKAAWLAEHLQQSELAGVAVPPGSDLGQLAWLQSVCLAQAQACFIAKGQADRSIGDGMLARLSQAAADLFAQTLVSSPAPWATQWCEQSQALWQSTAWFRRSAEHQAKGEWGAEIYCLQQAERLLPMAGPQATKLTASVQLNLRRALKDNELIYHEEVPRHLEPNKPAVVAKVAAPFDLTPSTLTLPHLRALPAWPEAALQRQKQRLMQALPPPIALDEDLPSELLAWSREVRGEQGGGVEGLASSRACVEALRQECLTLLPHQASLLESAGRSDAQVFAKYDAHYPLLMALGGSEEDLRRLLPPAISPSWLERDAQLRAQFEQQSQQDDLTGMQATLSALQAHRQTPNFNPERLNLLHALQEAHAAYAGLAANLAEGVAFYSTLQEKHGAKAMAQNAADAAIRRSHEQLAEISAPPPLPPRPQMEQMQGLAQGGHQMSQAMPQAMPYAPPPHLMPQFQQQPPHPQYQQVQHPQYQQGQYQQPPNPQYQQPPHPQYQQYQQGYQGGQPQPYGQPQYPQQAPHYGEPQYGQQPPNAPPPHGQYGQQPGQYPYNYGYRPPY